MVNPKTIDSKVTFSFLADDSSISHLICSLFSTFRLSSSLFLLANSEPVRTENDPSKVSSGKEKSVTAVRKPPGFQLADRKYRQVRSKYPSVVNTYRA